jgi:hypothetical protein
MVMIFKHNYFRFSILFVAVLCFKMTLQAQISGPCGLTLTVTNATNQFTNNGQVAIAGVQGRVTMYLVKPDGTVVGMGQWMEVPSALTFYQSGLASGNYTLYYQRNNLNSGALICSGNQAFTVGSGSLVSCATTEIGGSVFHDFNANGSRNNSEIGASGVTIRAFNAANTQVATTTSSSTGTYKLTGLTAGQAYRLEFSWADTYIQSGALGTNSASSVQFVNAGTCAADFGLNLPSNYCQTANPLVTLPCYVNGDASASAVAPMDALVSYPYNAYSRTDVSSQNPTVSHIATVGQVGALWGLAYQKSTKFLFGSAVLRRYAGFGSLGTGGIYKINMTNPSAPVVSNWVDVRTIGIPTGNDTRNGTPANTLSNSPGSPAWDAEAYNQIGKLSIGGIDFNDRGDTLWLVNLADKKLYGIRNVNPAVTPTASQVVGGYAINLPSGYSCASGSSDFRPWAIRYYKGLVYIGAMCTGESTAWTPNNMRGYILSFNPANPAAGFSHVANFPLNYTRTHYGTSTNVFQSWTNNSFYNDYIIQPMVTDLEFDVDGAIIVGISDRGGLQMGQQNYRADPNASDYTLVNGDAYGDVLKICKVGNSYIAENNAGCTYPSNPFNTTEFYWGDHAPFAGSNINFMDNAQGALAFVPGNGSFLTTHQDPSWWWAGGTVAISPITGGDVRRYTVYDQTVPGAQGKASGLGDIEPLCDPAPIEIGNRVWVDTDRDGIQDAGEAGLSGVVLELYQGTTLVATTTTDASGNYKFTNLVANTSYQIRADLKQTNLNDKPLSLLNVGANDLIDNDMAKGSGNIGFINVTTSEYGYNNHSFDIGVEPNCNASVTASANALCIGGTLSLTASSNPTGTYAWSGPNSFSSTAQNPSISNAQLIHSGMYTVTFTAQNGCELTSNVEVTVSNDPSVSITTTASGVCVGGNVTLNATSTGGIGTCTIQWQSFNGSTWNDINGATNNAFTTPPLSTQARYRAQVTCTGNGCCN